VHIVEVSNLALLDDLTKGADHSLYYGDDRMQKCIQELLIRHKY